MMRSAVRTRFNVGIKLENGRVFRLMAFLLGGVFMLLSVLSYDRQNIRILLILYLLSFLPFLVALRIGPRINISTRMLFLTALVFRLILLTSFPVFSDDVFRYLWEGKMQLMGINPYLTAPADPATIPYRDAYFELINHKTIPTIYPPLSELFFLVCMKASYNLYFFKAMLIVLDMGTLALLYAMIKKHGIPIYHLLIYAWHPLVVVEIAGSGHQDIIGMFFLVGCLYFRQKQNEMGSAAMLTGSFLSKLFPLFLFPLLLRHRNKWPYLVLVAMTILFYVPFYSADSHLFTGLSVYSKTWQANDSIFYALNLLLNNPFTAKMVVAFIFFTVFLYVYIKISDFPKACFAALGSFLILLPTLHPWYVLWIIPFLVITPNRAWIWLTMSTAAFYHILIDYFEKDVWQEQIWIKCLIYIPFFVLLVLPYIKGKTVSHA